MKILIKFQEGFAIKPYEVNISSADTVEHSQYYPNHIGYDFFKFLTNVNMQTYPQRNGPHK